MWNRQEIRVLAAGTTVVLAVGALFWAPPPFLSALDHRVCDALTGFAGGGRLSGRVVIVEIDERSVANYGRWPWPRERVGLLVRCAFEAGARTVALDAMFPESAGGTVGDEGAAVLAAAVAGRPAVIGYAFRFDGEPGSSSCRLPALPLALVGPGQADFFHASGAVCSLPELAGAAAGAGFLNASPDDDGKLRRLPLVIEFGNRHFASLALAALLTTRPRSPVRMTTAASGAVELGLGQQVVPLEGPACLRLRFRGGRGTFPRVSAADLLDGRAPAESVRGKLLLVGGTAAGLESPSITPVDALMPGVEIQATAVDNLLQGDPWRRPPAARLYELLLLLAFGVASTMLLALVRSLWAPAAVLLLLVSAPAASLLLLSAADLLISPLPAVVATGAVCSLLMLLNYRLERGRADSMERLLVQTRERTFSALAQSERRYQHLVENVNDAIIMVDPKGRLLFANRRFREWFGLSDRDIEGAVLEDYVAPDWRPALRERHLRWMSGDPQADHFEFEGIHPDGSRLWIEALVTAVRDGGLIIGAQSALRDITERKRMEAQYLQAQKMETVGRLAGGVAHDFNNLLTVINGYGVMLLARLARTDPLREYAEHILAAGERAADLTQKLLVFSRKQVAHTEVLSLKTLVADAGKMLRRVIGEDIELVTILHPDTGFVLCDRSHMHQVLMNLVVNARDGMPSGGTLTIETKNVEADQPAPSAHTGLAPGSYVYLGVSDTGVGMSEEVKRRLFEPFFTTKEPGKGTGLGLATVYGIVNQAGGSIRVESEPGCGASFHIYLPRTEASGPTAPGGALPREVPRGSETVMVVEDQEGVRRLAATVLSGYGYHVLLAAGAAEALQLAADYGGTIHLLLTDVVLPHMNGRALADAFKKLRPAMKVLYISGYSEEVIAHKGVLDPGVVCIPKPFSPNALAAKVWEVLAGDGAARP